MRTAALRELNEETGVSATITGLADTRDIITHDDAGHLSAHYVVTVFIGVWTKGEPRAASDCLDAAWVRITDLANYGMTEGTKALIEHVWETMVQATDCT